MFTRRSLLSTSILAGALLPSALDALAAEYPTGPVTLVEPFPPGGSIDVVFAREGDGAVLSVRDSGYGIPAAHLPRITERFYRVSTSRSRESGGTGLGLAIVKHVLGLHQARLEVTSEVGRGSTFSCHFGPARVHPRDADNERARA